MMVARDVTSCTWRQTYCHVVSLYRQGVPKCIEMQLARQESMHLLHLSLILKEIHAHIQTYIMCLYTHTHTDMYTSRVSMLETNQPNIYYI